MHKHLTIRHAMSLFFFVTPVIMAAPIEGIHHDASNTAGLGKPSVQPASVALSPIAPLAPVPDSSGIVRNRFISFSSPEAGSTALRVTFVSLHHVEPPYTGGPSVPFTLFEGQSQYVGLPTRYVESLTSGTPFYAAVLQCEPYYHDWSTVDLLHVFGEAIVPSSIYDIEALAAICRDHEDDCSAVSAPVSIETSRWGDIAESVNPQGAWGPTDFADISVLVDKFKDAPGAPAKSLAVLAGDSHRGLVDPAPGLSFNHVSVAVDAFRGLSYPHKPGKCNNNSAVSCISDEECSEGGSAPEGMCVLCGEMIGGACCHADGTCDVLPASECDQSGDIYKGNGEPCSRCCGPSPGCVPLNNFEWLDASQLWPGLDRRDVCKEAEEDPDYNCVSWTIEVLDEWIWEEVDLDQDGLWEYSDIEAFFAEYQKSTIIYGANNNAVLHTAKPLPNNCASSKAGGWIRMRHDRNQIEGGYYGDILGTHAY